MCVFTGYILADKHIVTLREHVLKGYIHVTTLALCSYTWLLDMYLIINMYGYNHQLVYATIC